MISNVVYSSYWELLVRKREDFVKFWMRDYKIAEDKQLCDKFFVFLYPKIYVDMNIPINIELPKIWSGTFTKN